MTQSFVRSIGQSVQSWFSQKKADVTDDGLVDLPDALYGQLEQQIQTLRPPNAYQTYVQTELAAALETWQQTLDAPNILVFLGSPVEPIADILTDCLNQWRDPPLPVTTPLPCRVRPSDPLLMRQQLQQALHPYEQADNPKSDESDDSAPADSLEDRTTLILLPSLEQCFLRCIDGWAGIDYLRHIAIHRRHCFWVIGCNHWAWNFLDFVCQISAYVDEVKALPALDGDRLKEWLDPIAKTVIEIEPDGLTSFKDDPNQNASAERRQTYWDALAKQSSGVSSIAASLWLQSLRVKQEAVADGAMPQIDLSKTTLKEHQVTLYETKPTLSSLPTLTDIDRYLLHSLLIHGQMTSGHLAFSLGQPESQIQSRIQALLREGVLERSHGALSVQAIHYSKLKTELANNNFFVSED